MSFLSQKTFFEIVNNFYHFWQFIMLIFQFFMENSYFFNLKLKIPSFSLKIEEIFLYHSKDRLSLG
jgi:hypothetical protein